jgi:hypothetical protein
MSELLRALESRLLGEIEVAKANIAIYCNNPVGIGEHPDLVGAIEEQLVKLAEADEKLSTLRKYFPAEQNYTITFPGDDALEV